MRWLAAPNPWTSGGGRPLNRMVLARNEFLAALSDIPGGKAGELAERIERARSLRELWHLRSSLYGVVALALSQTAAEGRLIKLNRYFPTRAPKSGLATSRF